MSYKKWNISLVVLFILTITSLLWLFAFQNIRSIIQINSDDLSATKSFYYAKAWVELWVALSNWYWIGFEDEVSQQDEVNQNFKCFGKGNCGTSFSISNRSRTYLTKIPSDNQKCSKENRFQLKEWESIVVPLFLDNRKLNSNLGKEFESILPKFKDKYWKNLGFELFLEWTQISWTDILLSFGLWSWHQSLDRDVLFKIYTWVKSASAENLIDEFLYDKIPLYYQKDSDWNDVITPIPNKIEKFGQLSNFLVISYPTHCPWNSENPKDILGIINKNWKEDYNCKCKNDFKYSWDINQCIWDYQEAGKNKYFDRKLEFCLKVWENLQKDWVATTYYLIDSQGKLWTQQASLQAIKKTSLSSWLFNTAINKNISN